MDYRGNPFLVTVSCLLVLKENKRSRYLRHEVLVDAGSSNNNSCQDEC